MDIRVTKTKNSIINTFLELRSKHSIEKITVKELCEKAMINKSTFYTHFKDIYDLSEYLENQVANEITANLEHPEYILTKPREFYYELFCGYLSQEHLIHILFSGSRSNFLLTSIENSIKNFIFSVYPQYREDVSVNILLVYNIYGSFYAFEKCRKYGDNTVIENLSNLIEKTQEALLTCP